MNRQKLLKLAIIGLALFALSLSACGALQLPTPTPTLPPPTPTLLPPTPAPYALICEIDDTGISYWIQGEHGEYIDKPDTRLRILDFDDGNHISTTISLDHERIYSESGNIFNFVGEIIYDIKRESVSYEITVTGDVFTEPQTCYK